jgi:hypothetical protein
VQANLSSTIDIQSTAESSRVDSIIADVFFTPKNDNIQTVLNIDTNPGSEKQSDKVRFKWESPKQQELAYQITAKTRVESKPVAVLAKVAYPMSITDIPEQYRIYIKPSKMIDPTDGRIAQLANNLAAGNDDLWIVASRLAIWVKSNIKYNLSTDTENVVQNASWTLTERRGVCGELTNLYIAMLRSIGVPARFISGIAYTDLPGKEGWGGHGWAEVYFPNNGWVPFDPTMGEFGWINPTHVKMMESADPTQPSTSFEWRGKSINITVGQLDMKGSALEFGPKAAPTVSVKTRLYQEYIGYGSYDLVTATVENLQPYYVTTELKLAYPEEIMLEGPKEHEVILPPKSKRIEFWTIRTKEGLQRDYRYEFPLAVYTVRNETATAVLHSSMLEKTYSLVDVTHAQSLVAEEERKTLSGEVDMVCNADKPFAYDYEQVNVTCTLKNNGVMPMRDVSVCLDRECATIPLLFGTAETVTIPAPYLQTGLNEFTITAKNPNMTRVQILAIDFRDAPLIELMDVEYPKTADYDSEFEIKFRLEQQSDSVPQDVKVTLSSRLVNRTIIMDSFIRNQSAAITLAGSDLEKPSSKFTLKATWTDSNGKNYEKTQDFRIAIGKINLLQRMAMFFRDFFSSLWENL